MIDIKKLRLLIITLLTAILFFGTSYAIWRHNAEVSFRLTIKKPADSECECDPGTYTTIQEGINRLRINVYNCIYNKMERFKNQLKARITELENLPFGSITYEELSAEVQNYRNVDINGFGKCINKYGSYINDLVKFYNNSSDEEKNEVPDFYDQHDGLWRLSDQLWHKRDELYDVLDALWSVGESKIDYNKKESKKEAAETKNEKNETSEKSGTDEKDIANDETNEIREINDTGKINNTNETGEANEISEDEESAEN